MAKTSPGGTIEIPQRKRQSSDDRETSEKIETDPQDQVAQEEPSSSSDHFGASSRDKQWQNTINKSGYLRGIWALRPQSACVGEEQNYDLHMDTSRITGEKKD